MIVPVKLDIPKEYVKDIASGAIDEIERIKDPNIKIDFSTKEVRELLNSVYKFTTKLNKEDKNNKIKFKVPSKNSKDNVVCLKDYLKYQKELAIAG